MRPSDRHRRSRWDLNFVSPVLSFRPLCIPIVWIQSGTSTHNEKKENRTTIYLMDPVGGRIVNSKFDRLLSIVLCLNLRLTNLCATVERKRTCNSRPAAHLTGQKENIFSRQNVPSINKQKLFDINAIVAHDHSLYSAASSSLSADSISFSGIRFGKSFCWAAKRAPTLCIRIR